MRFAVCLSRLPDPETVEVDAFTGEIDRSRILHILNPADGVALEWALSLRSSGDVVAALTVGPEESEIVLRDALAVGVDETLRIWEDGWTETRPAVTSLLVATALQMGGLPDVVFCGTRSLAGGSGKVPALIAEHLDWPVVTDVMEFSIRDDRIEFKRRLPKGARAEGEVTVPAVLAVEPSKVELRYASLPGMLRAKRATIPVHHLLDLGLSPMDLNFPSATGHAAMPPYSRPREIFVPDHTLPPHERIAQIMSAGVKQKSGRVIEGTAEEMADSIIAFLSEQGIVDTSA